MAINLRHFSTALVIVLALLLAVYFSLVPREETRAAESLEEINGQNMNC